MEGCALDQPCCEKCPRLAGTGIEGRGDLMIRKLADATRDKARAEIVIRLNLVRGAADDQGMPRQIDRVGDDCRSGIRLRGGPRKNGHRVGDP